jgi:hypothetical protein
MTSMTKFKGVEVEFSNGEKMIVPPLTLGNLETFQERLMKFKGGIDIDSISLVLDCTTLALQRNYPKITRDKVASELVDLGNMENVMLAVMDVSGLRRKEQEGLGEAQAGKL